MTRLVRMTVEGGAAAAGADGFQTGSPLVELRSAADIVLAPFERTLVPTGVRVALPAGCGGFVVTAPAMARRGLTLANAPGLVDEGYRGEVGLIAVNIDAREPIAIGEGDLVATMLVMKTARCAVVRRSGDQRKGRSDDMPTGATVSVRVFDEQAGLPAYAHETDNGLDLRCAEAFRLEPFERREVRLGIGIGLSENLVAQIQPRSGLALKQGLSIAGTPYVLADASVDDELVVPFVNLDPRDTIEVEAGTRVAQLVILGAEPVEVRVVDALDETDRGAGGFGSTGQ